jgi:hypothetical protein
MTAHNKQVLYIWRALCIGGIALSGYLGFMVIFIWYRAFTVPSEELHWILWATMGTLMTLTFGGLAYICARYSVRGIRHTDAKSVTRIIAVAWLAALFNLWLLIEEFLPLDARDRDLPFSFSGYFLLTLFGVIGYWFTVRYFLRNLGHTCPPVHDSLPKWILAILGYLLGLTLGDWATYVFGDPGEQSDWMIFVLLAAFLASIGIPIALYRKAVRAFATPPPSNQPSAPAKPIGPPPSMNMGTDP